MNRAGDGHGPAPANAALGIYAEDASTPDFTGVDERQRRAERWRLKWAADELRGGRQRACHRARQGRERPVTVEMGERRRAYYGGLQACGSVWACPLCASKISEQRRAELAAAIEAARAQGLQVLLMTLTVRHGMGDDVRDILRRMGAARRAFASGRRAADWRAAVGLRGSIRTLETTDGPNGWHPHYHILLFVTPGQLTLEQIQAGYSAQWIAACVKEGLPVPVEGVACTVQDGTHADRYVSKWGLPEEMSKGHLKHARAGRTPWDLLRAYADGDERAGARWQVYAAAFRGQVQLRWSRGLRNLLGLHAAQTDEEIAQEIDQEAEVLAELSDYERRALVGARALSAVLDIAETNSAGLRSYIQEVVCAYYKERPDMHQWAVRKEVRDMADTVDSVSGRSRDDPGPVVVGGVTVDHDYMRGWIAARRPDAPRPASSPGAESRRRH